MPFSIPIVVINNLKKPKSLSERASEASLAFLKKLKEELKEKERVGEEEDCDGDYYLLRKLTVEHNRRVYQEMEFEDYLKEELCPICLSPDYHKICPMERGFTCKTVPVVSNEYMVVCKHCGNSKFQNEGSEKEVQTCSECCCKILRVIKIKCNWCKKILPDEEEAPTEKEKMVANKVEAFLAEEDVGEEEEDLSDECYEGMCCYFTVSEKIFKKEMLKEEEECGKIFCIPSVSFEEGCPICSAPDHFYCPFYEGTSSDIVPVVNSGYRLLCKDCRNTEFHKNVSNEFQTCTKCDSSVMCAVRSWCSLCLKYGHVSKDEKCDIRLRKQQDVVFRISRALGFY